MFWVIFLGTSSPIPLEPCPITFTPLIAFSTFHCLWLNHMTWWVHFINMLTSSLLGCSRWIWKLSVMPALVLILPCLNWALSGAFSPFLCSDHSMTYSDRVHSLFSFSQYSWHTLVFVMCLLHPSCCLAQYELFQASTFDLFALSIC